MANKIEHINASDSLNDGRKKINDALGGFQTQIDTIVVEGDSSVEAAQARVKADGEVFSTLKARLDASDEDVDGKASQEDVDAVAVEVEELKLRKSVVVSDTEPEDADIWFEVVE